MAYFYCNKVTQPLKDKGLVFVSPDRNLRKYKNVFITKSGELLLLNVVKSVKEMEHFPCPWNRFSESELIKFLEYGQSILDVIKGESFGRKVINAKIKGVDYN